MSVPTEDTDRALVTVVPHTTALRGSRFEVTVSARYLKVGGFDAQGIVTIPAVRLIRRLGVLSAAQMRSVEAGLCLWLGIGFV
jgi:mRNA interferase MazF